LQNDEYIFSNLGKKYKIPNTTPKDKLKPTLSRRRKGLNKSIKNAT